jgi:23S rRNA (cytosine1962-C5)-methyltransferase
LAYIRGMSYKKVILGPKKERSLLLFHPWVFSGAISKVEGNPVEGEIVEVFASDGKYLATGHFHNGSIKVRIISFIRREINSEFWFEKLQAAYSVRENLLLTNSDSTNTYRLVHAEGDGLPGLIIDIYGSAAIVQAHTLGMHSVRNEIAAALRNIYGGRLTTIYDKSNESLGKQSGVIIENSFLYGNETEQTVIENGVRFFVNWIEGQKTGFFLDQRENRKLIQNYSKNKKVLNTFSYTGGFSMYALKGGAEFVHSVDSSDKAIKLCIRNAELNGFTNHNAFEEDVFDYLKNTKEQYDIIVLDPPAFAKHLSAVENAMVGYRNLNTDGIKRVAKGGLIFTFSCSQVIDRILFRKLVFQAAAQAKRNVRIIHQLTQGPDHPVSVYHPEGEYLKGLVLLVD